MNINIGYRAFNINDWYWIVGNSTTQVFSNARVQYVPVDDAIYLNWKALGYLEATAPTALQLFDVLYNGWLPLIFAQGFACTSVSNPTLDDTYLLTPQAMTYISGISTGIAAGKGLPGGGSVFLYAGHQWASNEFLNFASAVENYIYNFELSLALIVNTGSGSLPPLPIVID